MNIHTSRNLFSNGTVLAPAFALLLATFQGALAATTLQIGIAPPSAANEFNRAAQLTWTADAGSRYKIQCATNLSGPAAWQTLDVVSTNGPGLIRWTAPESVRETRFYRLALPQPEVFSVEPAVFPPGAPLNVSVTGQSFASNDVVRLDGGALAGVVYVNSGLLQVTLPSLGAGTHLVELVRGGVVQSAFTVTCADPVANSELVLQGPPEAPIASPQTGFIYWHNPYIRDMARAPGGDVHDDGEIYGASTNAPRGRPAKIRSCDDEIRIAPPGGGSANGGDEVEILPATGSVRCQGADLVIPGRGLDFIWARTYNSRIGRSGTASNGWTFSYDVRIESSGGDMVVRDGTGRADTFKLQTNGVYTCPEFFSEGTVTSGVFRLTFADTGYWNFNPLGASPSAGKLAQIVDRNGNTMTLNYDGAGRLTQVVDTIGRTNTVAYDTGGRVSSVTDFSGRAVTYQYYTGLPADPGGGLGDLKSVTSPPVTGTPNGNDFPAGKTTTYTYTSGSLIEQENHLLTTVMDNAGSVILSCNYNLTGASAAYLRCVSFQRWTNTPTLLTYLPQTPAVSNQFATLRCVVNDSVGDVVDFSFDARNRCVKLQQFTGRAIPGVAVTDTLNRPTGKVRLTDPDSYITRWSWNNDSLCTLEVTPSGRQVQCIFQSGFDSTTRARKRADLRVVRETATSGVDLDGDGSADVTERVTRYEFDSRFGSDPKPTFGKRQHGPGGGRGGGGGFGDPDRPHKRQHMPLAIWHPTDPEEPTIQLLSVTAILDHPADAQGPGSLTAEQCEYFAVNGGSVTAILDPRGNSTEITYDAKGNATNTTRRGVSLNFEKIKCAMAYNPQGELTTLTHPPDANNRRRQDTFTYSQGQLVQRVEDSGAGGLSLTNSFERDPRGKVTRFVDARGNDRLYTYNALDQCMREQSPVNVSARNVTDYFYDANNNRFAVTRQLRDEADTLITPVTDYFRHDPLHRVTRVERAVDAAHSQTNEFVFDGNDQCTLVRFPDAVSGSDPLRTIRYVYDERGGLFCRLQPISGSCTNRTDHDFNPDLLLARVSSTVGDCGTKGDDLLQTYDGFARLASATDAMGNVTTYNYDANDNLKVVRHYGQLNDVVGSSGNVRLAEWHYEEDDEDMLAVVRESFFDPASQAAIGDGERTTRFAYANNGQRTSATDDLGRVTTYTYDTAGRPASSSNPGGKTVMVCLKDPAGNTTVSTRIDTPDLGGPTQTFSCTNVFDSLNRCISTTDNVGNTNRYAYDSFSRLVKATDPRGVRSFLSYDLRGRQTLAIRDLDGDGLPSLTLDIVASSVWSSSSDLLLSTSDAHGNTTSYGYDSPGRRTSITNADGTSRTFSYDARSNLTGEQDANGTITAHIYDLNDRCTTNTYAPGPTVATTTTFERFTYDGLSQLASAVNNSATNTFTYDSLGRRTRDANGALAAVSTFDTVGNPLSLTYPGGRALTFTHDPQDRITGIVDSSVTLASFSYVGSRVERLDYANGLRAQYTYAGLAGVPNAPGDFSWADVSRIRHAAAAGSPLVVEYGCFRDKAGNTASATLATPNPALHTNTLALGYDNANRMLNSINTSNSALIGFATYGLDRMGNRTNINRPFCAGNYSLDIFAPAFDFQMNQYSSTPCDARTYDANGNLESVMPSPFFLTSYLYDACNRLVTVATNAVPIASYSYDALGRRISKTTYPTSLPAVTTTFLYDGGSLIEERVGGSVTASYTAPDYDDEPLMMRRAGQDYYFHTDDLGNVLALTTAGGTVVERYSYDDYGAVTFLTGSGAPTSATSSAVGNPYGWKGLRLDAETGLLNDEGGGFFDPQTGRDLQSGMSLGNNPWSSGGGGGKTYMNKGTVKFFNEAKGFSMIGAGGGGGGDEANSIARSGLRKWCRGDWSDGGGVLYAKGAVKIKGGAGSMDSVSICHATGSIKKPYPKVIIRIQSVGGHSGHTRDYIAYGDDDWYPIHGNHDLPCPIIHRNVLKTFFEAGTSPSARVYLVKTPRTVVQSSSINAKADSFDR